MSDRKENGKNPKIKKYGCSWIVLRYGHPVYIWSYNMVHDTWQEALKYAWRIVNDTAPK